MNNVLKVGGLILLGAVLVGAGVVGGVALGGGFNPDNQTVVYGGPMMGYYSGGDDEAPYNGGWQGRGDRGWNGPGGMMGGYGRGMMGGYGGGMMGGYVPDAELVPAAGETLTLDQAVEVVEAYLADYGDDNLELAEVMQFDNHFYAEVAEVDTGIHAFELLIDPETAAVYPEPGPNMMWNLKYGMHAGGFGGGRGMMGGYSYNGYDLNDEMTVTSEEALDLAQAALDEAMPGATVSDEADAFYGYYTIHILRDGDIVGMLSVNGFTGEVWLHTWHGEFIAMTEEGD